MAFRKAVVVSEGTRMAAELFTLKGNESKPLPTDRPVDAATLPIHLINATPKQDIIRSNRTAGANSQVFQGAVGPIDDAPQNGTPTPTDFPVSVNVADPNFVLSDLSVSSVRLRAACNLSRPRWLR